MLGPFRVVVPTVETVAERVTEGIGDWPGRPIVLRCIAAKYDAFAASRAALAASGTVALELALAGVPMVVAYRLSRLTEALLDQLLHVRRYSLVNLLLDDPVVPELVRGDCNPERIAAELATLIRDERVRSAHREGYDRAMRRLAAGGSSPSRNAADKILAIIAARREGEPVPQQEGVNP
jgi:lipid-A-disaccharide synthase